MKITKNYFYYSLVVSVFFVIHLVLVQTNDHSSTSMLHQSKKHVWTYASGVIDNYDLKNQPLTYKRSTNNVVGPGLVAPYLKIMFTPSGPRVKQLEADLLPGLGGFMEPDAVPYFSKNSQQSRSKNMLVSKQNLDLFQWNSTTGGFPLSGSVSNKAPNQIIQIDNTGIVMPGAILATQLKDGAITVDGTWAIKGYLFTPDNIKHFDGLEVRNDSGEKSVCPSGITDCTLYASDSTSNSLSGFIDPIEVSSHQMSEITQRASLLANIAQDSNQEMPNLVDEKAYFKAKQNRWAVYRPPRLTDPNREALRVLIELEDEKQGNSAKDYSDDPDSEQEKKENQEKEEEEKKKDDDDDDNKKKDSGDDDDDDDKEKDKKKKRKESKQLKTMLDGLELKSGRLGLKGEAKMQLKRELEQHKNDPNFQKIQTQIAEREAARRRGESPNDEINAIKHHKVESSASSRRTTHRPITPSPTKAPFHNRNNRRRGG